MTFDLGGYTTDFVKQLQEIQKKMAAIRRADNRRGHAMFGMMQQLNFGAASIRWDDDSLTNKVLEFVTSQGQKPEDIATQAKGWCRLPMGGSTTRVRQAGLRRRQRIPRRSRRASRSPPSRGAPYRSREIMAGAMSASRRS